MCEIGGEGQKFFCQKDPPPAGGGWGRDFPENTWKFVLNYCKIFGYIDSTRFKHS